MVELVINLKKRIVETYKTEKYFIDTEIDTESDEDPKPHNINNVTDTLASKIILGTFGCVPAYDENLVRGLGEIRPKTLSINGLNEVIKYANENKAFIENCKKDLMNRIGDASKLYTTMKIVDILLFGKGVHKK